MSTAQKIARNSLSRVTTKTFNPPFVAPVDWIENNFYLYDTAQLMTLFPWQKRPLELALSRDAQGHYRYNTILWSWPKKSAKSCVIAAVADWLASTRPRSQIKLIANDLKQADSRVGFYIRESIRIGQRAGKRAGIKITPSGYKIEYPNGSRIDMIPIDPSGEAGGNDDLLVYSELWGWKSKAHQAMWSEMTLSPNKFGSSQRWIDTYAGYRGESPILEMLYETGVKQGKQVFDDLEVYTNDTAKMLAVWVTKPLFPWQTADYYAEQASTLVPQEFERMHHNQWVDALTAFVPGEWWEQCRGDIPPLEAKEMLVIGMDAAVSGDSFAVVAVSRRGETVYVRCCQVWYPPPGGKIDFDSVEQEVRRLCKEYRVARVVFDAFQLHDMTTRLIKDGVAPFEEFPQTKERLMADKALYDSIRDRTLVHSGDPELTKHIMNAAAEIDKQESKLRLVKREERLKIDAAVALSMASHKARFMWIG